MSKLKTIILTLFLLSIFSLNLFPQELPEASVKNDKSWTVESYQSWDYAKDTTFKSNKFNFNEAFFKFKTNIEKFDFEVSAKLDKDYDVSLYRANLSYTDKFMDNVDYRIKFGRFSDSWDSYTRNNLGILNRTFDNPLSVKQYITKTDTISFFYETDKVGLEFGLKSHDFGNGTLNFALLNGNDNVKDFIATTTVIPVKNLTVGLVYNTKFDDENAILSKDSTTSTINNFDFTTFGGAFDFTQMFKKKGTVKVGGEFLYNSATNQVTTFSTDTTVLDVKTNSYVGTFYLGFSPVKMPNWTLLFKGDYFVPNVDAKENTNIVSTQGNLIWTPNKYIVAGFNYTYVWDNVLDNQYYTLGLKTGFNF